MIFVSPERSTTLCRSLITVTVFRDGGCRVVNRVDPRRWRLWSLPRGLLAYVLVVELATVLMLVTTASLTPITSSGWLWFSLLLGASAIHFEAAQGIERIREAGPEGSPYTHMQSVWYFAGVLLLPLPLLAALIVLSFTYE